MMNGMVKLDTRDLIIIKGEGNEEGGQYFGEWFRTLRDK